MVVSPLILLLSALSAPSVLAVPVPDSAAAVDERGERIERSIGDIWRSGALSGRPVIGSALGGRDVAESERGMGDWIKHHGMGGMGDKGAGADLLGDALGGRDERGQDDWLLSSKSTK